MATGNAQSRGDIVLQGARVSAGRETLGVKPENVASTGPASHGNLSIVAAGSVQLQATAARNHSETETRSKKSGFLSSKKKLDATMRDELAQNGVELSGNNVTLLAKRGDIDAAGASIDARGQASLQAAGDVNLGVATQTAQASERHEQSRSGLSVSFKGIGFGRNSASATGAGNGVTQLGSSVSAGTVDKPGVSGPDGGTEATAVKPPAAQGAGGKPVGNNGANSAGAGEAVPGPVNLMGNSDQFFKNASKRPDVYPNGMVDVIAHGSSQNIEVMTANGPVTVDHRVAGRIIENSPGYTTGQPIRLLSCDTGARDAGFAQNLSNKLGVPVQAPTELVWAYGDGRMVVAPRTSSNPNSPLFNVPDLSDPGKARSGYLHQGGRDDRYPNCCLRKLRCFS